MLKEAPQSRPRLLEGRSRTLRHWAFSLSRQVRHSGLIRAWTYSLTVLTPGIFLISCFGIQARGVQIPNIMIAVLIAFGGICQYICGIVEFIAGNTFGATVFCSYAAFNISYALIFLPATGILDAYVDGETGKPSPDFQQSLALYLWTWFILTVIYTAASVRTTWVLFLDLLALDVCLLLLAVGAMLQTQAISTAGYAFGFLVAALSCMR